METSYAVIVGGLVGVLAVAFFISRIPQTKCPKCDNQLPRFRIRKPNELGDAWRGGWLCQNCGARVALDGKLIP